MVDEALNTVLGVDLIINGENDYNCHYCLLKRKGDKLDIEGQKSISGNLVQVLEPLPKSYPLALNVSGKGILFKTINFQAPADALTVSTAAFPGVQLKDFYLQVLYGDASALSHIIRKNAINPVLDTFKTAGFKVFSISLGASVSSQLWSLLNFYGDLVSFNGHQFGLSENKSFLNYQYEAGTKNKFPLKIAQQALEEAYLLAYAAAFQLILYDKLVILQADVPDINVVFRKYIENIKLKKKAFLFLAGLFCCLLISFLTFSYYNNENALLAGRVGARAASAGQSDLLKKNIVENERVLNALNWNDGYSYAFILHEIGRSCPKQLSLNEIALNTGKKIADGEIKAKGIFISGFTDNLSAVNNWMYLLKEKKWLKTVRLLNYKQDDESDSYHFNLFITY